MKIVKFNRKPSLDRAKTYKMKVVTKADVIENIKDAIENLSSLDDIVLNTRPTHSYINHHHYTSIDKCNYHMAVAVLHVKGQDPEPNEIEYDTISIENLQAIYSELKEKLAKTI